MRSGFGFVSAVALHAAVSIVGTSAAQVSDDRLCADQNSDGLVTPTDFSAWINNFNQSSPVADVNGDGQVTATDFSAWINAFNQQENGPVCDVHLTGGEEVVGRIDFLGDIDTFVVDAGLGADLLFTIDEVSNTNLDLAVSVFDPSGVRLTAAVTDSGMRLDFYDLAASGSYTFVVTDENSTATGDYRLTAVVADDELDINNVSLTSGQIESGSVSTGDIDTFTINAAAGEDLLLTIGEVSNVNLDIDVSVYGPNGQLLQQGSTSSGRRLDLFDLALTGRYTYVVRDLDGHSFGDYRLTAVVVDEQIDADNVTLVSGQTEAGEILTGDIDTFTIDASAGDDLLFEIDEVSNINLDIDVSVYGPSGQLLMQDSTNSGTTLNLFSLAQSGRYTYVVRDLDGHSGGAYTLTATRD